MTTHPGAQLAACFKSACLAELEAIKPGNVHLFADGHGMVVQDFIRSAEAAAEPIAQSGSTVGERIRQAVDATWRSVGCNTNLGIVLLSAPLIHAVVQGSGSSLPARLQPVLDTLSLQDAVQAYQAILQASPGGLGNSEHHDVHAMPEVSLLEAMRAAEGRDRIAWQYTHAYADIFEFGLPRYRSLLHRWERPAWAATGVYLGFLARWPDTHIVRKYGSELAEEVRAEAATHESAYLALDNPKLYQRPLLDYDAALKARGINPGTSADLTVATLLAFELEKMVTEFAPS